MTSLFRVLVDGPRAAFLCAVLTFSASAATLPDLPQAGPLPVHEATDSAGSRFGAQECKDLNPQETVRLACPVHRLEGEVGPSGLWLRTEGATRNGVRFRVLGVSLGRERGPRVELPEYGVVRSVAGVATLERGGVGEEYTVGADGVRQDFVVKASPAGTGSLCLGLAVTGARAEAANSGIILALDGSERRLRYGQLHVTDARGKVLEARFEIQSEHRLEVVVADASAAYPIRIDPTYSDGNWRSMGALAGPDQIVTAVAADSDGNVYISGEFFHVGSVTARHVAKWDGVSWSALAEGTLGSGPLATSGTNLYIGSRIYRNGNGVGTGVARWDGSAWSSVGSGVTIGTIQALAVSAAGLIACGTFSQIGGVRANNIALWDGAVWLPLGTGTDGAVRGLAVSGTNVFAGGDFTSAGGVGANHVARWNGLDWSALGAGVEQSVDVLATAGGSLFVGGVHITRAGGVNVNNVARWNGSAWFALKGGVDGPVSSLLGIGDDLFVGGEFKFAGGQVSPNVAQWNGFDWHPLGTDADGLGSGTDEGVRALGAFGTTLYVGGAFLTVDGTNANRIAKWEAGAWSTVGQSTGGGLGLNAPVRALAVLGSNVYAGGDFTTAGGQTVNHVAKWDRDHWTPLNSGVNGSVYAMATAGAELYVAGSFSKASGGTANNIARWNGTSWEVPGQGVNGLVQALAVSGTDVLLGGSFTLAGAAIARGVARFNGIGWSGVGDFAGGYVSCLAVNGPEIYVGGNLRLASDPNVTSAYRFRIAKWDGDAWSFMGGDFDSVISAIVVSGANVYVAGWFRDVSGQSVNKIAQWNGTRWISVGSGSGLNVGALALSSNGSILFSDGFHDGVYGVSKWDGIRWTALGKVDRTVGALAVTDSALYVGGALTEVGNGLASAFVAELRGPGLSVKDATVSRAQGLPLKIRIADLASNESGEAVTLESLSTSAAGGTLVHDNTYIYYQPEGNVGFDSFTYTVESGSAKASGRVSINLSAGTGGVARSIELVGGAASIKCYGIQGIPYDVQRATSIVAPVVWTTLNASPLLPGADGSFTFVDSSPPAGVAYYRCRKH